MPPLGKPTWATSGPGPGQAKLHSEALSPRKNVSHYFLTKKFLIRPIFLFSFLFKKAVYSFYLHVCALLFTFVPVPSEGGVRVPGTGLKR